MYLKQSLLVRSADCSLFAHWKCCRLWLALWLTLGGAATVGAADPEWLGDAPPAPSAETVQRWQAERTMARARASLSVITTNREAVRNFFNTVYQNGVNAPMGWTGDIKTCNAGTTLSTFRDQIAERINYFRAMAGVPAGVGLDATWNAKNQQAAVMFSANNALSHTPPSSWKCYTAEAAEGASHSDIFLGRSGPSAITGFIEDAFANNVFAGHRRWILYPQTQTMGTGDVPKNGSYNAANATWVFDSNFGGPRPATRDGYVGWPPPGYVPYQVVFARWSCSYPSADFSGATVGMSTNGRPIAVTLEPVAIGYGENSIVWHPTSLDTSKPYLWPAPATDLTYTINVQNVIVGGRATNFTYTVTIFDPAVPTAGLLQGTYNGLIMPTNPPTQASSGSLKLVLAKTASFAANLVIGGGAVAFKGQFDGTGDATNTVNRSGLSPLRVVLHLDVTGGTEQITGTVSDGVFTAALLANRAHTYSTAHPNPWAGTHTCLLWPTTNNPLVPQGVGFGTLVVGTTTGLGALAGTLGDGTAVKCSVPVSKFGTWPWYSAVAATKGAVTGWVTLSNGLAGATLNWFHPPTATGLYRSGFAATLAVEGGKYVSPTAGGPALTGDWQVTLAAGNLPSNIVKTVTFNAVGVATVLTSNVEKLTLKVAPATGAMSGSFQHPATKKTIPLKGLRLQPPADVLGGFFPGTNQTGSVTLDPGP